MKRKNIIVIVIIAIILVAGGIAIYLMSQSNSDIQKVDVGVGTFNSSKDLNFTLSENKTGQEEYNNGNGTYTVKVINYNNMNSTDKIKTQAGVDVFKDLTYGVINGIKIYNFTVNEGKYAGEHRFIGIIENDDKKMDIIISSPNQNDTANMTNSFQFNQK